MFARFSTARNPAARIFTFLTFVFLAACDIVPLSPDANVGPQIDTSAPVQVALLVPSGSGAGNDARLAQNLENAARLAIADLNGPNLQLRVYNTAGNPAQAAQVAQAAVADGAQIILGPLYGEAAAAAGLAISDKNVNLLTFSNNPTVAGGNVFVLGNTFGNTANRLVQYSGRQGINRFHIVHAQDVGGEVGRQAIVSAIQANGGQVAGTSSYTFSQQGIISATPKIAADIRNSGATGVFLTADAGADLAIIATTLPDAGINPQTTRYIGLTRWDSVPQAAALPGLQGGLFAMPDQGRASLFANRYAATYGQNPHPLAGLAYDGIAAVGALVASGNRSALTKGALTTSQGFQGTSGVFRFLPNGLNQRALAVATIRNNQVVVLEAAPRRFGAGL